MRALVRIATPVGCAAIAACSFPVDGYTVVDASALQGGHPPVDAPAETTTIVDAPDDTTSASDTTTADDIAAPADTETPDAAEAATDVGADVDSGDACRCIDSSGGSGHCKTWDPPGCGT